MKKILALTFSVALLASSAAYADPKTEDASNHEAKGGGQKQYELLDGTTHSNPGEMFQHLRERDNGLASGNPKDIVDAYPDEFDNVGDLIRQKRVD